MTKLGRALTIAAVAAAARTGQAADTTKAVAVLAPAKDGKVAGTLTFAKADGGVRITGRISGLNPGTHGFHVHEFGDCSAPDFTSAGSHFNPTAQPHAGPKDAHRHAGDLGNVEAAADGSVAVDYTDPDLRFEGDKSIVGRAVVVHANADDLKTQPSGNAGGRVACGVVGVAKP
jgi:Cu-Zn family superoxide dismutase